MSLTMVHDRPDSAIALTLPAFILCGQTRRRDSPSFILPAVMTFMAAMSFDIRAYADGVGFDEADYRVSRTETEFVYGFGRDFHR